jgi:hypothetical protein
LMRPIMERIGSSLGRSRQLVLEPDNASAHL